MKGTHVEVSVIDEVGGAIEVVRAEYGSQDNPLRIGANDEVIEIPCYVLEDGQRVVVLSGMLSALDMKQGTAGRGSGNRLSRFISGKGISPFVSEELASKINNPIPFRTTAGALAHGFEATVISDLCDVIVQAAERGSLNYQLAHIVKRADILRRGFQKVGVIALVDEATGYQKARAHDALEQYLRRFISEELVRWVKTFPDEFYTHLHRLKGWKHVPKSNKRSPYVGYLTIDLVYKRLAPGALAELQRLTPRDDKGRRKHRFHQYLTEDIGHPRLREHLASVITLMRVSTTWNQFYQMLEKALPRYNDTLSLDFDVEQLDGAA